MAIEKSVRMMFLGMNSIYLIGGITCVIVGSYFHTNPYARRNAVVTTDDILSLICIGAIVVFNGLAGMFGFLNPITRRPILVAFCFVVLGIVVAQIVMGLVIWYKTLTMYDGFAVHWRGWDEELRLAFQTLDPDNPCCGFTGPTDFPATSNICNANTPPTVPGCQATVYSYAAGYLSNIYTWIFIFVFVGLFDFLTAVMVLQAATDEERYQKISQKAVAQSGEKMQFL
jgi:hypothetical protein